MIYPSFSTHTYIHACTVFHVNTPILYSALEHICMESALYKCIIIIIIIIKFALNLIDNI